MGGLGYVITPCLAAKLAGGDQRVTGAKEAIPNHLTRLGALLDEHLEQLDRLLGRIAFDDALELEHIRDP